MVQGGGQSKGGASKGGSSSEKLSEKKMRKMETRNLEEKLIVLRGALFEADGKDKDVCAALGPFMKYDRNGLDVKISFAPRLKDDVKKWAFKAVKDTMEDKYDAAGYGWDDADKLKELEEDGGRFLVLKEAGALVGVVHFRFTVQGDVVDKMLGDTVLMVHDLQIAPSHRRKGLGKHVVQLLEMAARKQKIARLSMQVMLGDDETRAFVQSLKGGKFAADESLEALVGFDSDLEGFDVMTLPLAPPVKKVAAVAEEEEEAVDEAAELRQTRDLLRQTVAEAFAKNNGREPTAEELQSLHDVIDAKLGERDDDDAAPLTGKEQRAKKRAARDRAAAAFEKAQGRAPTDAEVDELLAVVAPGFAATPQKQAPPSEETSPVSVASAVESA